MVQSHLSRPLILGLCLLCGASASSLRAETVIRLIDSEWRVPLEFWVKDAKLPDGGRLYYRAPSRIYVDGKPVKYGGHMEHKSLLDPGKAADTTDELLDKLTGKPEEAKITEVRSDRATEVLSGFKAEIRGDFGVGEHVLEPGGLRFRVDDADDVSSDEPAFKQHGDQWLQLLCRPVHLDFVPAEGNAGRVAVSVLSGGKPILVEQALNVPSGGASVRLYLPASRQPYQVRSSYGHAAFLVRDRKISLHGKAEEQGNFSLVVEGSSLGFVARRKAPAVVTPRVAAGATPSLYVFTDRNREVFLAGETIDLSVRGYGLPDRDAVLLLEQSKTLSVPAPPLGERAAGVFAAEWALDTSRLRPGTYRLRVKCGEVESNPLRLQIVTATPATNLKLFGWHKWGSDSFRTEDLADAVRNGLNLVVQGAGKAQGGSAIGAGNSPFQDWGARRERHEGAFVDESRYPELRHRPHFPSELLEKKLENDAGAEYLLAHGVENVPVLGNLVLYFNVGAYWQSHADDRYQAVAHLGQEWRRFPNFIGMVHCTGDGPTPATMGHVWAAPAGSFDIIHGDRVKKLREAFEYKVGKIEIDDRRAVEEFERINKAMRGAIGFGVGMDAGLEVKGDDALRLVWNQWVNDLYPNCFRNERAALAAMMPDPLVNCGTSWGQGIGSGMWTTTFYRALSHPVSDDHGDYGIIPFSYISGIDLKCLGLRKRPWMGLDLLPERPFANGLKLFLQALSRNPAGIGVLNTRGEVAGGWGSKKECTDSMAILTDIGQRFGDLLLGLERCDEVAIIGSMRQAATGGQSYPRLWGAHFLVSKAGYQACFVSEAEILKDPDLLSAYRAVMLVQMTRPLPDTLAKALQSFQERGGLIIGDEASTSGFPDAVNVKVSDLRGANEVNYQKVYQTFAPLTEQFRKKVRPRLTPFFSASEPHVHVYRSRDEDLEYWTLFHDGIPDPKERGTSPHFIQFLYEGTSADLTASTRGVLYDALRRERVEAKGALHWHADLRHLPGTFYMLADRPIDRLAVAASSRVSRGQPFRLRASLLDKEGRPFKGRAALEVTVWDTTRTQRACFYRTTNRDLRIGIAGNDPVGTWRWTAVEQATGLKASGSFEVVGEVAEPQLRATETTVLDAPAIHDALGKREFEIVLHPCQLGLRKTAEQLVQRLAEAGVRSRLRVLLPSLTREYLMNWNQHTIEDEEVNNAVLAGPVAGYRVKGKNQHGTRKQDADLAYYGKYVGSGDWVYYRDVILLGRNDLPNGPLFDLVTQDARMLPRNPSPNFPAPGGGLVAYAWAPFHYGHDAVVVCGADARGLSKAAEALIGIARMTQRPEGRRAPRLGRTLASTQPSATEAPTRTVVGTERERVSLLPPVFDREVAAAATRGPRLLIKQKPKLDRTGVGFAIADLAKGTATQYASTSHGVQRASLASFIESLGRDEWLPAGVQRLDGAKLLPVGSGLALVESGGRYRWFSDPFPKASTYDEARYPRRCQRFLLSADGKRILAVLYDLNVGGSYGPYCRTFNAGAVVLLDASTGREVCRYPGYCASRMAVAADGSRCVVIDDVVPTPGFEPEKGGRDEWNRHGGPVLAVFDDHGKELYHLPVRNVQAMATSRDALRAALTYDDPRRYVSLIDFEKETETRVDYPRTDTGIAVAPDGRFAVVCYRDGLVRKVSFEGEVRAEERLAAPGVPAIGAIGDITVAAADGRVYFFDRSKKPIGFVDAPVETLPDRVAPRPLGLLPLQVPPDRGFRKVAASGIPFTVESRFKGTHRAELPLPGVAGIDVAVFSFEYRLDDPSEELHVAAEIAGRKLAFLFPGAQQTRTASVSFRLKAPDKVALTLSAESGAVVSGGRLARLDLSDYSNLAYLDPEKMGSGIQVPRVLVPNIHGALYDPRVEQMAYGFSAKWRGKLPPDLSGKQETQVRKCFDGNVYVGTPLYPSHRPAGHKGWYPRGSISTLRSAEVIVEFEKPTAVAGLGLWEHPHDHPVRSFILECCNDARRTDDMAKTLGGSWKVAAAVRDNTDYYHRHFFPKPVTAKFWRYTIVDTPALVQRVAEIELYGGIEATFDLDGGEDEEEADGGTDMDLDGGL